MELEAKLELETLYSSPNVAKLLSTEDLEKISAYCYQGFQNDLHSRAEWEEKMKNAQKLALQVMEDKSFPWQGASNVKFPLLTIAAIQFHSRAYPALISTPDLVNCEVYEADPNGQLSDAADLISDHMSWQRLREDQSWEEEEDKGLLALSILGCVFKKSYFDKAKGYNVSDLVLPGDFVVDYWAKSLDTALRMTHIQYYFPNDFFEKVALGFWIEQENMISSASTETLGPLAQSKAQNSLTTPSPDMDDQPIVVLEQCCFLDLDGDGYKEPYVVTFRFDNQAILRVRARFFNTSIVRDDEGKLIRINPEQMYTKRPFIPSPDGGFYDLGFGMLLGPINQAIDSAINQLIDAGTMSNAGGGFLGKGVRVKGGNYSFTPNEWKRCDSTGDDLHKGIFPLPVREPSGTLFQLLTLLIQYGERVAGATDAISGENPGQNTKAETMQSMVEQGLQIFNGIYKRIYRSLGEEYRKLYILNQRFLDETQSFISMKDKQKKTVLREAYDLPLSVICPAADPNYMSNQQKIKQAQMVRQASADKPGLYNQLEVEKRFLQALKVPGIDILLVKEIPPPSPPVELQIEQARAQTKMQEIQAKSTTNASQAEMDFRLKLLELANEAELNQAKIVQLQAHALLFTEQAGTVQKDAEIAAINAEIGAARAHHDGLLKAIGILSTMNEKKEKASNE